MRLKIIFISYFIFASIDVMAMKGGGGRVSSVGAVGNTSLTGGFHNSNTSSSAGKPPVDLAKIAPVTSPLSDGYVRPTSQQQNQNRNPTGLPTTVTNPFGSLAPTGKVNVEREVKGKSTNPFDVVVETNPWAEGFVDVVSAAPGKSGNQLGPVTAHKPAIYQQNHQQRLITNTTNLNPINSGGGFSLGEVSSGSRNSVVKSSVVEAPVKDNFSAKSMIENSFSQPTANRSVGSSWWSSFMNLFKSKSSLETQQKAQEAQVAQVEAQNLNSFASNVSSRSISEGYKMPDGLLSRLTSRDFLGKPELKIEAPNEVAFSARASMLSHDIAILSKVKSQLDSSIQQNQKQVEGKTVIVDQAKYDTNSAQAKEVVNASTYVNKELVNLLVEAEVMFGTGSVHMNMIEGNLFSQIPAGERSVIVDNINKQKQIALDAKRPAAPSSGPPPVPVWQPV